MKTNRSLTNVLVLGLAVAFLLPVATDAASKVTFDNQSGKAALVKLVGPTASSVAVENGKKESVTVAPGHYFIKIRYGVPGAFAYSKGDEFDVTETATKFSDIKITLHKVVDGNYRDRPIARDEFENDGRPAVAASNKKTGDDSSQKTPPVRSLIRWPRIVLEVVSVEDDKKFSEIFSVFPKITGKPFTDEEFQSGKLTFLSGKPPSIREIIKKYGKPDKVTNVTKELNTVTKEKADYECYNFDNIIFLDVKKGSDELEWFGAPALWWIEGLRKRAQQELDKSK